MLTPAFDLQQDNDFLILQIKAPYSKISETEIFFEGTDFKFYSKPYFLRLNLPGCVNENGSESATYNADEGSFSIKIPKASPGEWFEGLDLQTKLLAPRNRIGTGPLIEVLATESNNPVQNEEYEEFDWEIYQNQYTEEDDTNGLVVQTLKYGFASQKDDIKLFTRIQNEVPDLFDVRFPHQKTLAQRRDERRLTEEQDFSDDHYLADLYEDDEIKDLLTWSPPWLVLELNLRGSSPLTSEELVVFSEQEKTQMRSLPNKEYILCQVTKQGVLLNLVDILYAFAYNSRITEGTNTVESDWTIAKLSATLSWLETFPSLETVVASSVRRSLCYPLHRHWDLALTVLSDTRKILSLGRKYVLKCLLEIHSIFSKSDSRYILNDLYITDYCIWIQTVKDKMLFNLAEALQKVSPNKGCLGLDLPAIEQAAALALRDEQLVCQGNGLTEQMQDLTLACPSSSTDLATRSPGPDELLPHSCESASSESSSSDDSSSSLDSDDYSSSENEDSSDDDNDSDSSCEENCLLLGNVQRTEKIR